MPVQSGDQFDERRPVVGFECKASVDEFIEGLGHGGPQLANAARSNR